MPIIRVTGKQQAAGTTQTSEYTHDSRLVKKTVARLPSVIWTPLKIALNPNVSPRFCRLPFAFAFNLLSLPLRSIPLPRSLPISSSESQFLLESLLWRLPPVNALISPHLSIVVSFHVANMITDQQLPACAKSFTFRPGRCVCFCSFYNRSEAPKMSVQ